MNPENAIPGGVSKPITAQERDRLEEIARAMVDFSRFTLVVLREQVLANPQYVDLILNGRYCHRTYSMGLVDDKNRTNFYDGKVRVVDPEGHELCKYAPRDYAKHIAERVEPWTYLKFPYLTQVGWKGFVDGKQSGVYRATPQARLNVADSMSTPLAQEAYRSIRDAHRRPQRPDDGPPDAGHPLGPRHRDDQCRRARRRAGAPSRAHAFGEHRTVPHDTPTEGVGIVEAPRGTLVHHYVTDENGLVRKANLVVGTTNNHAAICMSIKQAAQGLITRGSEVTEGVLNMIEMAFRAYDPCFGCATRTACRARCRWSCA